jgi:hypothetical protein
MKSTQRQTFCVSPKSQACEKNARTSHDPPSHGVAQLKKSQGIRLPHATTPPETGKQQLNQAQTKRRHRRRPVSLCKNSQPVARCSAMNQKASNDSFL